MKFTNWRVIACMAIIVSVAGVTAVSVSAAESKSAVRGGTYVVGWESSFGWTNGFDPTGEYLANAISIYQSLLIRRLVGYNHVAGAAGNKVVPDLAPVDPAPHERRQDVDVHVEERRHASVRP